MIEEYLDSRRRQFETQGFTCCQDVEYGGYHFAFVAAKTRFGFLSLAPAPIREVFVFAHFDGIDVASLQNFAEVCSRFVQDRYLGSLLKRPMNGLTSVSSGVCARI